MKRFLKKSFLYLVLPCMICFAPYTAKAEDLLGGDVSMDTADPFSSSNDLVTPPDITAPDATTTDPSGDLMGSGSTTAPIASTDKPNPGTGDLNGILVVSGLAVSFGLAVVIKKYKDEVVN